MISTLISIVRTTAEPAKRNSHTPSQSIFFIVKPLSAQVFLLLDSSLPVPLFVPVPPATLVGAHPISATQSLSGFALNERIVDTGWIFFAPRFCHIRYLAS